MSPKLSAENIVRYEFKKKKKKGKNKTKKKSIDKSKQLWNCDLFVSLFDSGEQSFYLYKSM